jgi:negative regulator of flagellin synthesis FlgM
MEESYVSSKINGIDTRTGPVSPGHAVTRTKDAASEKNSSSGNHGEVDITRAARQLADIEQALAAQSPIDEKRVAEVAAAIEQGRYTISPDRIADQLVQLERALDRLDR